MQKKGRGQNKDILREERLQHRWSQQELAEKIGTTPVTISRWENGVSIPSPHFRLKLTQIFGKSATILGLFADDAATTEIAVSESGVQVSQKQAEQSNTADWPLYVDLNDAPDNPTFYGRTHELAWLEQQILLDKCRMVILLGMGGIGKTALAIRWAQQATPHFEFVLWRSLRHAPPVEELVAELVQAITEQARVSSSQYLEQSIAILLGHLRQRRCLLILDNIETILQAGDIEGRYQERYTAYGILLQRVAEVGHQSCLLLTSREMPDDLRPFTGQEGTVRTLSLSNLGLSASQQMLTDKGLEGETESWQELVRRYAGNPLALKIVAASVHELFHGKISAFLNENIILFRGLRLLLDQQFERLSPIEQDVLYWLAIERDAVSLTDLQGNFIPPLSRRGVLEALGSLQRRSLLESGKKQVVFTLQPVVLEYVTERLGNNVSAEIIAGTLTFLLKYALMKGQVKEYLRQSQLRLLIEPLLERVMKQLVTKARVEERLLTLLDQLREMPPSEQRYGVGNIVNLLVTLNGQVNGLDCSQLTVWQMNLQGVEAHDMNLAGANLSGSLFQEAIGGVASIALSPNGKYLATGGFNGQLRLWDLTDENLLMTMQGHIRMVWSLTFSPDSSILASSGYDSSVKIWDVSSGQCLRSFQGHHKWVKTAAFRDDGKMLATASDDGSLRLWNLQDGTPIKILHQFSNMNISPPIAFGRGNQLIVGGDTGEVQMWDVESGDCQTFLSIVVDTRTISVACSPDGSLAACGMMSGTIIVYDLARKRRLYSLHGHSFRAWRLIFCTNDLLVSVGHDGTFKLWKISKANGYYPGPPRTYASTGRVWSMACNPQGQLALSTREGNVELWKIEISTVSCQCMRTVKGYAHLISALAFSLDGTLLVSGDDQGMIRLWQMSDGKCLNSWQAHRGRIHSLVAHPQDGTFSSSADDATVKIWNVRQGHSLQTLRGHQSEVWSVNFSPDGKLLASCSVDHSIKLWNLEGGHCLITLRGHKQWPWSVIFSPDGNMLASGSQDGQIKLWERKSGCCLHTLQGHTSSVWALNFTDNGNTLLSSSDQEVLKAWDVQSGQELRSVSGDKHTGWLRSVTFSQDGSWLALSNNEQALEIWQVENGEHLQTLERNRSEIWSTAFSSDGRLLANGTDDGTITIWETRTGTLLQSLHSDRPYERMNISRATGITEAQRASLKALGAYE